MKEFIARTGHCSLIRAEVDKVNLNWKSIENLDTENDVHVVYEGHFQFDEGRNGLCMVKRFFPHCTEIFHLKFSYILLNMSIGNPVTETRCACCMWRSLSIWWRQHWSDGQHFLSPLYRDFSSLMLIYIVEQSIAHLRDKLFVCHV